MARSTQYDRIALVTGASGGIGAACAVALGRCYRLFLADIVEQGLDRAAAGLREQGIEVAGTMVIDMAAPDGPAAAVAGARAAGPLRAVVNAAGLSPSLGDARAILEVNAAGAERLLLALENDLSGGLVTILIASMAGHIVPPAPVDALLADPTADKAIDRALDLLGGSREGAYSYSKRANLRSVERRAARWGQAGARIASISPALIRTAMGTQEAQQQAAAHLLAMTPLGWGEADDIGAAAAFLCSPAARFITGTDLKVDGGICAVLVTQMGG